MKSRLSYLFIFAALSVLALVVTSCAPPVEAGSDLVPASGVLAAAQTSEPLPRTVTVNGTGVVSASPDIANIVLGVETVNTDAGLVVSENNAAMAAVLAAVQALGVADEDIQTVAYNMWVEQVYNRDGEPTGEIRYHVVNQANITLRDLSQTGQLLQTALEAGANTVGGITFGVAEPGALQSQARDLAVANATAKATQLAAGFGASLGAVRQVSEYSQMATPQPAMEAIGRGGGAPISAGSFNVIIEIQVIFDLAQ